MKRHLLAISTIVLSLFPNPSWSSDDPCIQALSANSPGLAGAASGIREQAREKAFKEAGNALEGKNGSQDNDAQYIREYTAKANDITGNWHAQGSPMFGAGIPAAIAKGDFKNAAVLGWCVEKRGGQAAQDKKAAEENHRNAVKTTQQDTERAGYDANVVHVEQ